MPESFLFVFLFFAHCFPTVIFFFARTFLYFLDPLLLMFVHCLDVLLFVSECFLLVFFFFAIVLSHPFLFRHVRTFLRIIFPHIFPYIEMFLLLGIGSSLPVR